MILYIHGFGSCGDSTKTRLLKAHFGEEDVLAPDVPVEPDIALSFLRENVKRHDISLLIGSSLGGFYATALCREYGIDAVLLNPSVHPYQTLASYVGINRFWCSAEPFEWKSAYLQQLARIAEGLSLPAVRMLVLLQTDDEVLDFRIAREVYRAYEVVVEEGGNHRFENLSEYLDRIGAFYAATSH